MKKVFLIISSILFALVSIIVIVHAQSATIDLSLSTNPLNPIPGQQVTVSAQSYSTDLNQATMVWTYNNKIVASGTGITEVTVQAPASGSTGVIAVTASGGAFDATVANITLRPASVDLLWEGIGSYTPPFYKGRALPSSGSVIKVTAVPTISAPQHLSYTWSQNGDALQSQSGYDKSSVAFQNDYLTPQDEISVTEQNGGFSGNNSVVITPGDPTLVGYFANNGYTDYANGSTDRLSTTDTGAIVHFEPYFFSVPNSIAHDLTFSYNDNDGNNIPGGDNINELVLSRPDGGGQSQFTIAIHTVLYSLQNLSKRFAVNFN